MKTRNKLQTAEVVRYLPTENLDWTQWLDIKELRSEAEVSVYDLSMLGINYDSRRCDNCNSCISLYSLSEVEKLEKIASSKFDGEIPF